MQEKKNINIYDEQFEYFQDIYFSKPQKLTAEEKAYRLIVKAIKTEYRPGDMLQEKVLAESFNMSRTPITIALHRLISEGILKKMPKKGCIIPNLVKEDAKNAFNARKLLEVEGIKTVIENNRENELEALNEILVKTKQAVEENNFSSYSFYDEKFHYAIMFFYNNPYIYESWKRIYLRCNLYTRQFDSYFSTSDIINGNTLKEHTAIFEAIKDKNVDLAVELCRHHIEHALIKLA